MKKKVKVGYGILLYAFIFSAAIIGIVLLVAVAGNSGLNNQLKTHVTAGTEPRLGCGYAKKLVEENLSDNNYLYSGTATNPVDAYNVAKNKALTILKTICEKDPFTCNGGTITDSNLEPTGDTKKIDYACPDNYPPYTTNACRPGSEKATGTEHGVFLVDANGQRHSDNDFRLYCTIEENETRWENVTDYIVSCLFVGECQCQIACDRILPQCNKIKEATAPPDCKGQQGFLSEGPVTGQGEAIAQTEQAAKDEAKKKAIAKAKSNLQASCGNWDKLHVYSPVIQPECTLSCAGSCQTLGYKAMTGTDRQPFIDSFTCGDVTAVMATPIYNPGVPDPVGWRGNATAVGCVGRCLMQRQCKYSPPTTSPPPADGIPK